MSQESARNSQSDGVRLTCRAASFDQSPNIVLVHPLRGFQRPDSRFPIVESGKILGKRSSVDEAFSSAWDHGDLCRTRLSPSDGFRAAKFVHLNWLCCIRTRLHRPLILCQGLFDIRGHHGWMDAIESLQELEEHSKSLNPHWLPQFHCILWQGFPCDSRGVG